MNMGQHYMGIIGLNTRVPCNTLNSVDINRINSDGNLGGKDLNPRDQCTQEVNLVLRFILEV